MVAPLAALMATDYVLTVFTYHYSFSLAGVRDHLGVVPGGDGARAFSSSEPDHVRARGRGRDSRPTLFFVVSNYAVWVGGDMYPRTMGGLIACYAAAVPFYRNDVLSTGIVAGLAFGLPVLVRRMNRAHAVPSAS